MGEEEVPLDVRHFISAHITSVAQLETLLLLKTNPTQVWSPEAIARELRIDKRAASDQLAHLERNGVAVRTSEQGDAYRYNPATPELDAAVVALAQSYLVRRVTIIGLIFSGPSSSLRAFSDAFRIRREDENG